PDVAEALLGPVRGPCGVDELERVREREPAEVEDVLLRLARDRGREAAARRARDLRRLRPQAAVDLIEELVADQGVDEGRGEHDRTGDRRRDDEDETGAETHGSRRA